MKVKAFFPNLKRYFTTVVIARAAVIAALYFLLTYVNVSYSFLGIQLRLSEVLTILPLFMPEAIPGLYVGCLLANMLMGNIFDIIFGSLATLLAAVLTRLVRKIYFGIIPPVMINALVVPLILLTYPTEVLGGPLPAYYITAAQVFIGQLIVIGGLGVPLYFLITRNKTLYRLFTALRREAPRQPVADGTAVIYGAPQDEPPENPQELSFTFPSPQPRKDEPSAPDDGLPQD